MFPARTFRDHSKTENELPILSLSTVQDNNLPIPLSYEITKKFAKLKQLQEDI